GVRIEIQNPGARDLLGSDEGGGAQLGARGGSQRGGVARRFGRGLAAVERIADLADGALRLVGQDYGEAVGTAGNLRGRCEYTVGIVQAEGSIAREHGYQALQKIRP